jgi:hypothetical protein
MATPLYKRLKENGTSFYCFPSSSNDISKAFMNSTSRVYFSKFVLLNIPKQNLTAGTSNDKIVFDFENTFIQSTNAIHPSDFGEQIIESLRNYVANYETTIKESRLNNTDYYYDLNSLVNPSEKIFWRWAKKLNLIDLEVANSSEYFTNLLEFERKDLNEDDYLPEYLWSERKVIEYNILYVKESGYGTHINKLEIEFNGLTSFKVGDYVNISIPNDNPITSQNNVIILDSYINSGGNHCIILDYTTLISEQNSNGTVVLNYHRLVQYIGEVSGVSNVALNNKSYSQIYAHIPAHAGTTPTILFRTKSDNNYKPNLSFPILPSQYQPEIRGAENFSNPLVAHPENYGGSHYGQFDTDDFTYETAMGDSERRNGDYYGAYGNYYDVQFDSQNIDGLTLDFEKDHYTKMNQAGLEMRNFDEFNTSTIDRDFPDDFEFNAILWYYRIEDDNSDEQSAENLYGIEFLDNPNNNIKDDEIGIRFPLFEKRAQKENSDGTSYGFNLNMQYLMLNENPQETYQPESINAIFNFNLFQEALQRFSQISDIVDITNNNAISIKKEVEQLKQLLYTQSDLQTINKRITDLTKLMQIYNTLQLQSSDSIKVNTVVDGDYQYIQLENTSSDYGLIKNISTTDLYFGNTYNPLDLALVDNVKTLYNVINNDTTNITLNNNDNLTIILSKDLMYKQSIDFIINANVTATENKQLDIYINSLDASNTVSSQLLIGNIDLPVYKNRATNAPNYSSNHNNVDLPIDLNAPITIQNNGYVVFKIDINNVLLGNMVEQGDSFIIENFDLVTDFSLGTVTNFDGQYEIDNIDVNNGTITFKLDTNVLFMEYLNNITLPYVVNTGSSSSYALSNIPKISLNKGYKITITRIDETNNSGITERYKIEKVKF